MAQSSLKQVINFGAGPAKIPKQVDYYTKHRKRMYKGRFSYHETVIFSTILRVCKSKLINDLSYYNITFSKEKLFYYFLTIEFLIFDFLYYVYQFTRRYPCAT